MKTEWTIARFLSTFRGTVIVTGLLLVAASATAQLPSDSASPHIVVIAGDAEYGSRESMRQFARDLREKFDFNVTLIESMVGVLENEDNPDKTIPNLGALDDADLLVVYIRMRIPPQEQLDRLDAYFKSGKPAIGLRTSTHAFTNDRGWAPRYFGGHYWRHDGDSTESFALPHMHDHPVLRGVPLHETNNSSLYISNPLSHTADALVMARFDDTAPPQPFAWVNEFVPGARQFFLTAGHPEDVATPGNQALLFNAVFWALGREVPKDGVLGPQSGAISPSPGRQYPDPPAFGPIENAIPLFTGADLAAWDTSFGAKEPMVFDIDGRAHSGEGLPEFDGARWPVRDGYTEATPGHGDIVTRELFDDVQLHLDFLVPESLEGTKRIWRGNSGVYLNGRYEIQILDSYGETDLDKNSNGAINGLQAPSVNASKPAAEWQSLDVYFRAARLSQGEIIDTARATVVLNGETIHDNVELPRPTEWGFEEDGDDGVLRGPVRLQADSALVRFANVWVRPLTPMEVAQHTPTPPRLTGDPWADIDYGPSKKFSLQVAEGNIAYKGLAVRLDEGQGGISSGNEFMIFDTDTLRWAGGWSGPGFNDWRGIALNGQHEIHPSIVGDLWFANPVRPGWGRPTDGSFVDERVLGLDGLRYGPLAHDWGRWKGHYIHGDNVILSYTVGDTDVLELAGAIGPSSTRVMTRTINLGPREHPLTLQVAQEADASIGVSDSNGLSITRLVPPKRDPDSSTARALSFDGKTHLEIESFDQNLGGDFTVAAGIRTTREGTIFAYAPAEGPWAENSRALFVREGRLVYDVGWVGDLESEEAIDDGEWHYVAMTYDADSGRARLYIDGRLDASKRLAPKDEVEGHIAKIGFASPDFPEPSHFRGNISEVLFYPRRLSDDEIRDLEDEPSRRGVGAFWYMDDQEGEIVPNAAGRRYEARIVSSVSKEKQRQDVLVAVRDNDAGTELKAVEGDGDLTDLRLTVPAGPDPVRLTLFYGRAKAEGSPEAFASVVQATVDPIDLSPLTEGGPPHWPETLVTQGKRGDSDEAYAIDTLTHPEDNPYRSWMRFGGFDFFEDDSRAALCTWNGDVWLVDGIDESLEELKWRRIASGMFQPLGIAVVDGDIYVACRDQITILRDLNGDGETDFYENFNSDHQVTEHFHEFALDLKYADGNFYYTKGGRHGADAITPNHGTLIRVSRDGSKSEFVANGFRAPNGLGLGPAGEMLVADNQGHWIPANRINWIEPGGFYGYMWGYHNRQTSDGYDEPLCWIHPSIDRSPGTFEWVPDYRWGPLRGRIISVSYGMGQIFHVLHEEVDGVRQGGVVRFPLEFDTGVTRAKFRKRDGQLYLAGLFGWAGNKTKPGGFYRVRYTGKPIYMPEELHVASDGVSITFTDKLDPDSATDPSNYAISRWNYKWTAEYGSPDFKMDGTEGRDSLRATWAALSSDRRTVYLEIPGIAPVMQMQILVNVEAGDGVSVRRNVHHTVHRLGPLSVRELSGVRVTARSREPATEPAKTVGGLVQTITSRETGATDTRASRLAALFVDAGDPPSPFVPAGPFRATWSGFIKAVLNEPYRFGVEANGNATVLINGASALTGSETNLKQGLNPIEIAYVSPPNGPAQFRLYWESDWVVREPIPATALVRSDSAGSLEPYAQLRRGRELVAQHRCLNCHAADPAAVQHGMPELRADAPALDRAAAKYHLPWIVDKILDPQAHRADARMPRLIDEKVEAEQIAAFLDSLSKPMRDVSLPKYLQEAGRILYQDLGCFTCHHLAGEDALDRISHAGIGTKWHPAALVEFLIDPHRAYAYNPMPNFQLSQDEARALSAFLLNASPKRPETTFVGADMEAGRQLVEMRGCLNCHSIRDHHSALNAKRFSEIRAASTNASCLAATTAKRGVAPDFGFDAEERVAIAALLEDHVESLFRYDPAEYAERQIAALNCRACHARDDAGDRWSTLAPEEPPDKDDALETIHAQRPHLHLAGEKLRTGWMSALLAGQLDYKPRPGLTARMPAFPAQADGIARGIAAQHGFEPVDADVSPIDADRAAVGKELALSDSLFRCNSCHGVGPDEPLAGADTETINFAHISDRLRRGFYDRFTLDPQRVLPGSQMPQYPMDDGSSPIPDILDGDTSAQFDAIWQFMRSLSRTGSNN